MSGQTAKIFQELVKDLGWFHPNCNRHIAETLLMENGQEGSYLIRPSSLPGEYAVSVRCKNSVKHFNIVWNGQQFVFGLVSFSTTDELLKHFSNQPFIAGESGIITQLKFPYPKIVTEPSAYETVRLHAQYGVEGATIQKTLSISSKEGFMTKLGGIVKNWKMRWFVLHRNELSYFKDRNEKEPIRTLRLAQCRGCSPDETAGKKNCFKLEFSWRTFYLFCDSLQEMEEWINIIEWKLKNQKEAAAHDDKH